MHHDRCKSRRWTSFANIMLVKEVTMWDTGSTAVKKIILIKAI